MSYRNAAIEMKLLKRIYLNAAISTHLFNAAIAMELLQQ
jgi:hypothetical protein